MRGAAICHAIAPIIAACPTAALARDDAQLWLTTSASIDLGKRWRVSEEVITRLGERRGGLYEIESNTLLGYRLAPRLTVWAGYTHDPTYEAGRFAAMEQRARQQVTFDNLRVGPTALSLRVRTEQRWRDGMEGTGWRVRPFVRAALPLRAGGRSGFAISHESFLNLNRNAFQHVAGMDRMRNTLSFYAPLGKVATIEIGYLNQRRFLPDAPDETDHAATASIAFAFR